MEIECLVLNVLLLLVGGLIRKVIGLEIISVSDGSTGLVGQDIFFEIVEPEDLKYTYRTRPAKNFGPTFTSALLEKNIRLVPFSPPNGCSWPRNAHEVVGNVALIERGHCSFLSKTILAEGVGARAVIIADNKDSDEYFTEMIDDLSGRHVNIPATFLLGKNGLIIRQTLAKLKLKYALINIPVNVSYIPLNEWKQPPWMTW